MTDNLSTHKRLPIGVFDSGIGGLTVVKAIMQRLPHESIIYFGDTARVPYGIKSAQTIQQFSQQIVDFLLNKGVKLLVIACNTIAAVAAEEIQKKTPLPILDVLVASAKAAVAATHKQQVGVIGTLTTIHSQAYDRAIHRLNPQIQIFSQACPLLVPLVEEGWLDHPVTQLTAQEYLQPLLAYQAIDTLVLGCTHYPLLKPLLTKIAGPGVALVDSADTLAAEIEQVLTLNGLQQNPGEIPHYEFYVSDVPQRFQKIGEQFLGRALPHIHVVGL